MADLRFYQISNDKGERRVILSDWDEERVARLLDQDKQGFEIETTTDPESVFGCPLMIVR